MAKILTLNTHSWMEDNQEQKLTELIAGLSAEKFDVICLQEINQEISSPKATQLKNYSPVAGTPAIAVDNFALTLVTALEEAGLSYYWSWAYNHIGYRKYHEGVAILSRTPLSPQSVLVSAVDNELDHHTRRVLVAETTLDDVPVTVCSLHLSWWDQGFIEEWQTLETYLNTCPRPLVLMGDFNNPTDGPGYNRITTGPLQLSDSHLKALHREGTATISKEIDGWVGNNEELKVDHIFTTNDFQVASSQVIFNGDNYPVVSDHCGLAVTLAVQYPDTHD